MIVHIFCMFFIIFEQTKYMNKLSKYNEKRDFNKTKEPSGKIEKSSKRLRFVVQHHIARKDHYDLRLEKNGVMISFAVPKGPSYNPKDKRLAVHVEDHPISYNKFEGVIPKGEYGAGTVMIWDKGYYTLIEFNKDYIKFKLNGKRLKGIWTLVRFKDENFLLIKEDDGEFLFKDINEFNTSIKSGKTMDEISGKTNIDSIEITNPDKKMYKGVTKQDIINYYKTVEKRILPFIKKRILSTVRCPKGIYGEKFFKKHFDENKYLKKKKGQFYINDAIGIIREAQMNAIEFHITSNKIDDQNHPDIMVFDLDPDEKLNIKNLRQGVKDLKRILDKLELKSYLKTSGGKGYHILVPIENNMTYKSFYKTSKKIAEVLVSEYPDKYTIDMSKKKRKNKIFIDYLRNNKNSSCVCPYSLRARKSPTISMPIKWSDLDKIKPADITIKNVDKYLKRKDPWEDFPI